MRVSETECEAEGETEREISERHIRTYWSIAAKRHVVLKRMTTRAVGD